LLLTPGKSSPLSEDCLQKIGDTVKQVIAPASAHWIHLDEPDLVIQSIREMVTAATGVTAVMGIAPAPSEAGVAVGRVAFSPTRVPADWSSSVAGSNAIFQSIAEDA
jgi:hypothetical protein